MSRMVWRGALNCVIAAAMILPAVAGTPTQTPGTEKLEPCRPLRWSWAMPEAAAASQKPPRSCPNDTALEVNRIVAPIGIELSPGVGVEHEVTRTLFVVWQDSRLFMAQDSAGRLGEMPSIPEAQVAFLHRHAGDLARLRELLTRKRDPEWSTASFQQDYLQTVLVTDAFLSLREGKPAQALADLDAALLFIDALGSGPSVFDSALMDGGRGSLSRIARALRFVPDARPCPWIERLRRTDHRQSLLRALDSFAENFRKTDTLPWEDGTVLRAALAEGVRPYVRTCARNAADLWHEQVVALASQGRVCGSQRPDFQERLMASIPAWNRVAPRIFQSGQYSNSQAAENLMEGLARLEWELELTERVLELREFGADPARRGTLPAPVPSDSCTGSSWVFTRVDGGRAVEIALQPEPAYPPRRDWSGRFHLRWPPD